MKLFLSTILLLITFGVFSQSASSNNVLNSTGLTAINSTTNAGYKLSIGGATKLFGNGTNVVGSPTLYLTNNTATTGRNYFINSDDNGTFQITDGTSTPVSRFVVTNLGNVGLGISSPDAKLHVNGNTVFQGLNTGIEYRDASGFNHFQMGLVGSIAAYSRFGQAGDFVIAKVNSSGNIYISNQQSGAIHFTTGSSYANENIIMSVLGNNVGIGTTDTKGYKLAVNGSAIFTKAVVKVFSTWPDYVFDDHYKIPSLSYIENFIKTKRHLPGVPSADEINKDGIDLASFQSTLLQKTEELTLYIIDQNKKIDQQAAVIDAQGQLLLELQKELAAIKATKK